MFFKDYITLFDTAVEASKVNATLSDFWLFVVCCIIIIFVALFFLFYFNCIFARIITILVNQYLWRRYEAYIQLDSVRVTILGARILFKNFRYHSTNESFKIVRGHISIQYWLRNIRIAIQLQKIIPNYPVVLFAV
ncbi:unnamed protein product [Cunninghamella blakesleeana]